MADTSPLRAIYERWQAARDEYNASASLEEAASDAVYARLALLEQQAAEFEPNTLEDLAFKVIIADDNGDLNASKLQVDLVARCWAVVGLKPRIARGAWSKFHKEEVS